MALTPGARLGPYEILSPLGAGGMGEVYRARDTRLERDVAIKVLPPDVTTDAERLRRFEQEARAVASLNHPNILGVYDIGHTDPSASSGQGAPYIVAELLEGETLRSRLAGGPLTVRKAVEYAVQIARGLAAAHEKRLVHRDLKPDNVFITADQRVKILDFGLAKLVSPADLGHDDAEHVPRLTLLPTTPPQTAAGAVLGTMGYMAPEQVRGLPTDHRADIFALGGVIYEMLSGRRAFNGDTAADVMTAILKEEPPELPADVQQTAPALVRIVDRCLAKNPGARFTSADDLAFALDGLSSSSSSTGSAAVDSPRPASRSKRWLATVAGVGLGSVLTAAVLVPLLWQRQPVDDKPVVRLQLTLPDDVTPVRGQPPAVSPDSTRIALVAVDQASGTRLIYLRALNSMSAQSVRGTDRAIYPFWSADGAKMGFFADGRLKTVDLATGTVQDVCAVPNPTGPGIWVDDTIIYPRSVGAVYRVSASGGTPGPATPFDLEKEVGQSVVGFLADRRRIVFGTNATGVPTLRIGSTDGVPGQPLAAAASRGWLHAPWLNTAGAVDGHLLFLRGSSLFAVGINGVSGQITGEPEPLAQALSPISSGAANPFSVQDTVLAYVSSANSASRLVWVNRQGQTLGPAGTLSGFLRDVRISPDGSLVTVSRFNDADRAYDLMLLDLGRMTTSQLTYGTSSYGSSWLPDQSGIVFMSATTKGSILVRMAPREGASPSPVLPPGRVDGFMPDPAGRSFVYTRITPEGSSDLYLQSLEKREEERPFLATPAVETGARFSPDGAWIAYQSNESGTPEVFIRSFPGGGEKQQASRRGGYRPVWRRDGKELFYMSSDGDLMAAAISLKPSVVVGPPEKLFRTPIDPGGAISFFQFDVHPDNERFIMAVPVTDAPQPVNVILNWQSLLKK